MSGAAEAQRCEECDGVQPLRARECEICGAVLDGSLRVVSKSPRAAPRPRRPVPEAEKTRPRARAGAAADSKTWAPGWPGALRRASLGGLRLAAGWTLLSALIYLGAALALTFAENEGTIAPALSAAWYCLRLPLLIGLGIGWGAGACYDLVQLPAGRPAWSGGLSYRETLLGVAAPAVFLFAASQEGAVPPSAWELVPYAAAAGFLATLALKLLDNRLSTGNMVKLASLATTIAVLGLAWVLAPRSDIPTPSEQLALDHRLEAAIPIRQCSARPIEELPAGLLRNSLAGLVHCHRSRMQGTFMAFRDSRLLDVYVAYRKHVVDDRREHSATRCNRRSGSYTGDWFKESRRNQELGAFICFGKGHRRATLQWEDSRSTFFATLSGRGRVGLYHWWHLHQVTPGFRN